MPKDYRVYVQVLPNDPTSGGYTRSFAVRAPIKELAVRAVCQKHPDAKIELITINPIIEGAWAATESCSRLVYQPTQADFDEWMTTILGFEKIKHEDTDPEMQLWVNWDQKRLLMTRPGYDPVMLRGLLDEWTLDAMSEMLAGILSEPSTIGAHGFHD
jgi:hypothetical protein